MSKVKVHQANYANAEVSDPVFGKVEAALDGIRRRAFELFQMRGCTPGRDLDDWLQAETEVLFAAHTEVNENEEGYRMMISVPGFDPGDIDVIALPRELVVEAKTETRLEPIRGGSMRAGSLEERTLYRRFELGAAIETDKVTARIDEGSLTIEAPKRFVRRFPARAAAA